MNEPTTLRDNVDAAEVAKFDALASRWWDPEGDFHSLHEINPLRLDWIREHASLRAARSSISVAEAASWPSRWHRQGQK